MQPISLNVQFQLIHIRALYIFSSPYEVDDHQMKNDASKDEVPKRPLRTNTSEVRLVLRVGLDPKTD